MWSIVGNVLCELEKYVLLFLDGIFNKWKLDKIFLLFFWLTLTLLIFCRTNLSITEKESVEFSNYNSTFLLSVLSVFASNILTLWLVAYKLGL